MASTDPTRTLTVRREFSGDVFSRWRHVKGLIRRSLVDNDALRVQQEFGSTASPGEFADGSRGARVQNFMAWLRRQTNAGLLGTSSRDADAPGIGNHWAGQYIRRGYAQGAQRARQQTRGAQPDTDRATEEAAAAAIAGGVATILALAPHEDGLEESWDRAWNELRGIVEETERRVRRRLDDGLRDGESVRDIVSGINSIIDDVGVRRSRILARTEVVRAHAEAQLNEFKRQGVREVGAELEFRTARDNRVCSICAELEGQIFSVDSAYGIIPIHPNCRCIWLPVVR